MKLDSLPDGSLVVDALERIIASLYNGNKLIKDIDNLYNGLTLSQGETLKQSIRYHRDSIGCLISVLDEVKHEIHIKERAANEASKQNKKRRSIKTAK